MDRVLARDFSMMIQSIGMTSASIFILTRKDTVLEHYKPLFVFVPVSFAGFVLGMLTLQGMPVYLIQALFLSLTATFVVAYYFSEHRGHEDGLRERSRLDQVWLWLTLLAGGAITSLFGTGADILLYTLLITHFAVKEKPATYISIVLQAALSILGYGYRAFIDQGLTAYQIKTWLCAYPVVLIMVPFGAYVLAKIHVSWLLIAIIALNAMQLLYFNVYNPAPARRQPQYSSASCCRGCSMLFYGA